MNLKPMENNDPKINKIPDGNDSFLQDMKNWICDSTTFAWQYIWRPSTLGTPFVCSPFVAKEILKYVNYSGQEGPQLYLEAGSGTGAITRYFVEKKLRPQDELHLVEINQTFCDVLKKKYAHLPNVFVHNEAVQDWSPSFPRKFDAIISTVPLNSLPSGEVLKNIFNSYLSFIKPEGTISSLEYVGISTLCKVCFFGEAKKQFKEITALKKSFFDQYSFEKSIVIRNIPPVSIDHCRVNTTMKKES